MNYRFQKGGEIGGRLFCRGCFILFTKLYKQNKKLVGKHAAASFTADFLFCSQNYTNKIKNPR